MYGATPLLDARRSTFTDGEQLTAGFWSQTPDEVLDGSVSDAWWKPKKRDSEKAGTPSSPTARNRATLHDILFSSKARNSPEDSQEVHTAFRVCMLTLLLTLCCSVAVAVAAGKQICVCSRAFQSGV